MTARGNGAASDVYEMRLSRATLKLNAGEFAPATPMKVGGSVKRKRSIDGIAQRGRTRAK